MVQNLRENICASLFFNKVTGLRSATLLKKFPTLVFYEIYEFCEIFKNTFLSNISGEMWARNVVSSDKLLRNF